MWMENQPKEDRFNNQAGHQSEPVIEWVGARRRQRGAGTRVEHMHVLRPRTSPREGDSTCYITDEQRNDCLITLH